MQAANAALRHQIILPAQRTIYDYWRSLCRENYLPSREDIDPVHICEHLSMLSLTAICGQASEPRFQFRLAGTGFWNLFDDEIQGRFIDELPLGDRCEYWQRVLTQIMVIRRPSAGVTRPGTPNGGHMLQFWIRMPLSSNGRDVDLILGYDHLVMMSEVQKKNMIPQHALTPPSRQLEKIPA